MERRGQRCCCDLATASNPVPPSLVAAAHHRLHPDPRGERRLATRGDASARALLSVFARAVHHEAADALLPAALSGSPFPLATYVAI